ncbi:MAG: cyclic nucleotide-binding domain-containing protein [Sinobacteraceae bacterium]|nr:cyclic nucleotide-binding domain-containing protein [Nevskiaceae bacterium]
MTIANHLLQSIYLFKDLNADALDVISRAADTSVFDSGQDICREGQPADGMYLLRSGSVRVTKADSDADMVVLGAGSHFGELGLVDDSPRSATVTAMERCEVITIKARRLADELSAQPAVAAAFYRVIARSIARRLRVTTDDLASARQFALSQRRSG